LEVNIKRLLLIANLIAMFYFGYRFGLYNSNRDREYIVIYPTIKEMQIWCGAEPDGKFGPETALLYNSKLDKQYCEMMALEIWENSNE